MEHRRVGKSGLWVSAVAYGTGAPTSPRPEEEVLGCVAAALDAGITTFDTADSYGRGRSERLLGRAFTGLRRESLVILTKVCFPTGPGPNDHGLSRKHIRSAIDGSLCRLNTDYVDVYQAHRFDHRVPLEETMVAFADLVRAGKVRYLGVSEWTADQIRAAKALADELKVPLVANQPQYSMLWRVIEARVLPACQALGIGQLAWSPTAQGVLTGKYDWNSPPPAGSRGADEVGTVYVAKYSSRRLLERVKALVGLAAELGISAGQLAVAWVLARPGVACAIIGASRPAHVAENAAAAGIRLDDDVLARIDAELGTLIERDPDKTGRPYDVMEAWRGGPQDGIQPSRSLDGNRTRS